MIRVLVKREIRLMHNDLFGNPSALLGFESYEKALARQNDLREAIPGTWIEETLVHRISDGHQCETCGRVLEEATWNRYSRNEDEDSCMCFQCWLVEFGHGANYEPDDEVYNDMP